MTFSYIFENGLQVWLNTIKQAQIQKIACEDVLFSNILCNLCDIYKELHRTLSTQQRLFIGRILIRPKGHLNVVASLGVVKQHHFSWGDTVSE